MIPGSCMYGNPCPRTCHWCRGGEELTELQQEHLRALAAEGAASAFANALRLCTIFSDEPAVHDMARVTFEHYPEYEK